MLGQIVMFNKLFIHCCFNERKPFIEYIGKTGVVTKSESCHYDILMDDGVTVENISSMFFDVQPLKEKS